MARRVHSYLRRSMRWSHLHFTLIDPDKQSAERAGLIADAALKAGSHAILVGGSTGVNGDIVNATVKSVKERVHLPVILFPGGAEGVSPHADAIFFMTM